MLELYHAIDCSRRTANHEGCEDHKATKVAFEFLGSRGCCTREKKRDFVFFVFFVFFVNFVIKS
jgi:hypothetical protein